jgi:hypothetical protein
MFKIVSLVALGAAAVSANFLNDLRVLQFSDTNTPFSTACTASTTAETCTQAGYCCATVTRLAYTTGATATNFPNINSCVPAEIH